jgi:dTDP-4-amino-4,6-dideoxygalactose transaminase
VLDTRPVARQEFPDEFLPTRGREQAEGYVTQTLPYQPDWSRSVYHIYAVRVVDRAQLQKKLDEAGIGTGIHYPIALRLAKAYEALGFCSGDFPVSEKAVNQVLSLPMFPDLTSRQQDRVAAEVLKSVAVVPGSGSR